MLAIPKWIEQSQLIQASRGAYGAGINYARCVYRWDSGVAGVRSAFRPTLRRANCSRGRVVRRRANSPTYLSSNVSCGLLVQRYPFRMLPSIHEKRWIKQVYIEGYSYCNNRRPSLWSFLLILSTDEIIRQRERWHWLNALRIQNTLTCVYQSESSDRRRVHVQCAVTNGIAECIPSELLIRREISRPRVEY